MNLKAKIEDIIAVLSSLKQEEEEIAKKRVALENFSLTNSSRDKQLNEKASEQAQKQTDLDAQQTYITNRLEKNTKVLEEIRKEREATLIGVKERQTFDEDKLALQKDQESFIRQKVEFEKKKAISDKQEAANTEYGKLLEVRERRIKAREEYLDNMDRQTQLG